MAAPAWEEMTGVRNVRRSSVLLGLTAAACVAAVLPALASGPAQAGMVGPMQFFTGVINGKDGNTIIPITIHMRCALPLKPGESGHPVRGQTLAVHQEFPPAAAGSLGQTGNDSEIGVFFAAPPPAAARPGTSTPVFTRYDRPKPLPTSLTLPCAGTSTVYFTPIPVIPPSQSATAPVRYVARH
jgi:hypothetical protein